VSEGDAGSELTIDHFRPVSRGGGDNPDNLVYCCHCCNEYKGDYWNDEQQLWNPRLEPREHHLLNLGTGIVHPSSPVGAVTIALLRLNRPALIAHRRQKHAYAEWQQTIRSLQARLTSVEHLTQQQAALLEEQQRLLSHLRLLLRAFLEPEQ
jgi:hypothetical protein